MAPVRRLQQYAIWISILSIVYNGAEGGISIAFGAETSSRSLVFFGIQSAIEVASAAIVLWRFLKVARPGEEDNVGISDRELKFERYSTLSIGVLLLLLSLGTEVSAAVSLGLHQEPDSSTPSLIISASALVVMILIWLPKRYLARALNSSAMQGEATCSLSCIQITCVLFIGSLIFRVWKGGWWLDEATSMILGLLFGWEGFKMVRWARDPRFDGGCCDTCRDPPPAVELGEQYRDICECCEVKEECKAADTCQNPACDAERGAPATHESSPQDCCAPQSATKCCTRELRKGPRPAAPNVVDRCCSPVEQYRAIRVCCDEKEECRAADTCQNTACEASAMHGSVPENCCAPQNDTKCCTRELRKGPRPTAPNVVDHCCSPSEGNEQKSPSASTAASLQTVPRPSTPKVASKCCSSPGCTD